MRAGGADEREAKVRVGALAGFEHGVLAIIVCPAAIAALITGAVIPRSDFTWPWALIPVPAFVLFIWLAERYRDRLRGRGGWWRPISVFFDVAHVVHVILRRPRRHGVAVLGMAVYWGADMFALSPRASPRSSTEAPPGDRPPDRSRRPSNPQATADSCPGPSARLSRAAASRTN